MSEEKKTPFEQAEHNIKCFVESADLLQTLSGLLPVIEDAENLIEEEKKTVLSIVEASLRMLSQTIEKRGQGWN